MEDRMEIRQLADLLENARRSISEYSQKELDTENELNNLKNQISLSFRSADATLRQSMTYLENSDISETIHPEFVFQHLLNELLRTVHAWRLASVRKGDICDKISKSLFQCLIKCCKNTGVTLEKTESLGMPFQEFTMKVCKEIPVSDPSQSGLVIETLIPGLKLRGMPVSPELICLGKYQIPDEKIEDTATSDCIQETAPPSRNITSDDGIILKDASASPQEEFAAETSLSGSDTLPADRVSSSDVGSSLEDPSVPFLEDTANTTSSETDAQPADNIPASEDDSASEDTSAAPRKGTADISAAEQDAPLSDSVSTSGEENNLNTPTEEQAPQPADSIPASDGNSFS